MGTSRNAAQLNGKLKQLQGAVKPTNREAVKTSGTIVQNFVDANIRSVAGGDLELSNAGPVYTMDRWVGAETIMVRAVGPVHWLEDGVDRHDILPGARRGAGRGLFGYQQGLIGPTLSPVTYFRGAGGFARSRKGAGVALKFNGAGQKGRGYTAYVRDAGGFKAAKVWTRGKEAAEGPIRTVFRTKHTGTLQRIFG